MDLTKGSHSNSMINCKQKVSKQIQKKLHGLRNTEQQITLEFNGHCQKLGTRWRLRVRTKATMAANSYKKMYGDKETFSNISIMSSRVFGARLETC